jgi:hypothetical protein
MLLMVLAPLSSQALFEVRAGYGVNKVDDSDYDLGSGNSMTFDKGKGLNADFIFTPPLLGGVGFGLRYELLAYDFDIHVGSLTASTDAEMKRLSLLVNYRILDNFIYLGPIGTLGLSTKIDDLSGSSADTKTTWSAGVEGGVSLGLISVGAEIGKLFGETDPVNGTPISFDGIYTKILVGFGF